MRKQKFDDDSPQDGLRQSNLIVHNG